MSKTIIVTGASRGIGFSILKKFAANGFNLAFCSVNEDSVKNATNELKSEFPDVKVFSMCVDMSVKSEVQAFATKCIEQYESIDVLVNNAGYYVPGNISDASYDDRLEFMMNINMMSAYWMGKTIVPSMVKNKKGQIFNICSIAGIQAYPNGGSYSIAKFALQGYTRTLREELKDKNVKVTGIYPGATLTDSWSATDFPKDRFIQVEDISDILYGAYNLSDSAVIEDIVVRPQLGDI